MGIAVRRVGQEWQRSVGRIPVVQTDHERVLTWSADEGVAALPGGPDRDVVAAPAELHVRARAADEDVVAVVADLDVVAAKADQDVVPPPADLDIRVVQALVGSRRRWNVGGLDVGVVHVVIVATHQHLMVGAADLIGRLAEVYPSHPEEDGRQGRGDGHPHHRTRAIQLEGVLHIPL